MRNTADRRGIATIPDVARQAGVSTATAARALGGYGSVRAQTRDRVLAVAEELGYRANSLARSMITGSTHTLGVVLSDIENSFFHRALRGVADTARAHGYEVLLSNTDEDLETERKAVSVLAERRVDGLVVCPTDDGDHAHLEAVISSGIPVVLLDRRVSGLAADTVGIDNRKAAKEATTRLIEQGHRRIGILTGGTPASVGRRLSTPAMKGVERLAATTVGARAAGYRDALLAAGVSPRPEYLSANGFHREDAAAATRSMMMLPEPPTAIFAFDSVLALGALQAFRAMGLHCPADVSLIGFDDAEWAEVVSPPLSVVAQPVYEIGVAACNLLLARINGEQKRPVHQRLRTTFVDRESVAAPPGSMRHVS
jgi:LacI family transcriptional regulator